MPRLLSIGSLGPSHHGNSKLRQAIAIKIVSESNSEVRGWSCRRPRTIINLHCLPLIFIFSLKVQKNRVLAESLIVDHAAALEIPMFGAREARPHVCIVRACLQLSRMIAEAS